MKKLSFVIISFILLLNITLNAQSKKYNIFSSDAIDISYAEGFLSTHFGPKSTGRIKFLVLDTVMNKLKKYGLREFNNDARTTGGKYFYQCLKVLRDKGYEGELLFYPTYYDETLKKNCVSLYYYDQLILVDFDRKCPRINGSYQFSETAFIVMVLLDDDLLVAKKVTINPKGQPVVKEDMTPEFKEGYHKSCVVMNSTCDKDLK